MSNDTIKELILSINGGSHAGYISLRPCTKHVKRGNVWPKTFESEALPMHTPYRFYFIFNDDGICVGAVCDMSDQDLHVYTLAEHRQQSHMKNALRNAILPHLKSSGRIEQCVTYQTIESERLFKSIGFQEIDSGRAKASLNIFQSAEITEQNDTGISEEQMLAMQRKLWMASACIRIVQDGTNELFNEVIHENLEEMADDIESLGYQLEKKWWDCKSL